MREGLGLSKVRVVDSEGGYGLSKVRVVDSER